MYTKRQSISFLQKSKVQDTVCANIWQTKSSYYNLPKEFPVNIRNSPSRGHTIITGICLTLLLYFSELFHIILFLNHQGFVQSSLSHWATKCSFTLVLQENLGSIQGSHCLLSYYSETFVQLCWIKKNYPFSNPFITINFSL